MKNKDPKKMFYPQIVDEYVSSNDAPPGTSKTGVSPASVPVKGQKYESKSSLFGLINHANQLGDALGLSNPARRKKVIGISLAFLALMALVISASPSNSSEKDKEKTSIGVLTEQEPPSAQDISHFMEDKPQKLQQQKVETMTPVAPAITSTHAPQPTPEGVHEISPVPEPPQDPDPSTMLVYSNRSASASSPAMIEQASYVPGDAKGSQTFIKGKLISNIQVSSGGGPLAIGQLEDGRIVYGNALMAPEIDRVYINFTEEQSAAGDRKTGLHYVVTDKEKTQGLRANCSDLGKGRNLIAKSMSVGYNVLSAVAGATSTRAYSPQDVARDRAAQQLQNEASYADQSGRVRFCSVNSGSEFYIVMTGAGR